MKRTLLIVALLLVPALALASDFKWSNYYEGVAGGTAQDASLAGPICDIAKARAHALATAGSCANDPYGSQHKQGVQVGQIELPCTCQCSDNVCICTDKLEIVCLSQEK